jgi:predicted kinase
MDQPPPVLIAPVVPDSPRRVLVLMSGLPGVGKSTIASELGRLLPAVVLSVDHIEDAMLRAGLAPSFETGVAAYEVGATVAREQLALGHSVIADAANYIEVGRDVWRRAVRSQQDAAIRVVHVECSDLGAHEQRLRQRNRGLSHYPEPTWADVEQRRLEVEPWSGDVLVVDSAEPLDATVAQCLTFLRA